LHLCIRIITQIEELIFSGQVWFPWKSCSIFVHVRYVWMLYFWYASRRNSVMTHCWYDSSLSFVVNGYWCLASKEWPRGFLSSHTCNVSNCCILLWWQVVPSIAMVETYVRLLLVAPQSLFRQHYNVCATCIWPNIGSCRPWFVF
jgi:hypothetical protein